MINIMQKMHPITHTPLYTLCDKNFKDYNTSFATPHKWRQIDGCMYYVIFERKNKIPNGKNYFVHLFGGPNGFEFINNVNKFKGLSEETAPWTYFKNCCK